MSATQGDTEDSESNFDPQANQPTQSTWPKRQTAYQVCSVRNKEPAIATAHFTFSANKEVMLLLIQSSYGSVCDEHFVDTERATQRVPFKSCSKKESACCLASVLEQADRSGEGWTSSYLFAIRETEDHFLKNWPVVLALSCNSGNGEFCLAVAGGERTGPAATFVGAITPKGTPITADGIVEVVDASLSNQDGFSEDHPLCRDLDALLALASKKCKTRKPIPATFVNEDSFPPKLGPFVPDAADNFAMLLSSLLDQQLD